MPQLCPKQLLLQLGHEDPRGFRQNFACWVSDLLLNVKQVAIPHGVKLLPVRAVQDGLMGECVASNYIAEP